MTKKFLYISLAMGVMILAACTEAPGSGGAQQQDVSTDENIGREACVSMESGENVQMDKRQCAEELYAMLGQIIADGGEEDAWGGEVLLEFYSLFMEDLYPVQSESPEWVFMFGQLYNWQFMSFHEGVYTFYTNFYESDVENGIQRMSDCLYRYGYQEISKWYDYGIFDYSLYPDLDYPAEYCNRMAEIDTWIGEHTSAVWQVYLELLLEHKEEVLAAAADWVPDCGTEEEMAEKEYVPESSGQQDETPAFHSTVELVTEDDTKRYDTMSYVEASEIDQDLVSQMAGTNRLSRIQTCEAFPREALQLLDEKLFAERGDIMLRIYGLQDGDLKHFEDMVHVRRLHLDGMEDLENIEVLSRFGELEELKLYLPERSDYSFVNRLSPGLEKLTLYVNFLKDGVTFGEGLTGGKLDYGDGAASLYELKWLLSFPDLKYFYIGFPSQHIEFLIREDAVRELVLCEMPCPSLEVLRMLDVQSVIVHQENVQKAETDRTLERLWQQESLQEIELVRIADIDHLEFPENMSALRKLTLRSLPGLTSLPRFPEGQKLAEFAVYDCEKLTDLSAVSEIAQQWCVH